MSVQDGADEREGGLASAGQFPCTLLQKRLWREYRAAPASASHNVAMRWMVHGRLTHTDVEDALNALIQRYEILRTGFCEVDGEPVQVIWSARPLRVREIDLVFLDDEQQKLRAQAFCESEAADPMAPDRDHLVRAAVLKFAPTRSMLLLTFHAIIADGWSIGRLVREFRDRAAGGPLELAEPEIQFADYALWEREALASGGLQDAFSFWRRELAGAQPTRVPGDAAPGEAGGSEIVSSLLSPDFGQRAAEFARLNGVTVYAIGAAAIAAVLHRITGRCDIVIGSQVANREDTAAETLIGPLVNAITLRIEIKPQALFNELVRSTAATIAQALEHQRLPFEAMTGESGAPALRHAINLVVQHAYAELPASSARGGFFLEALPSCSSGALFELNFFMIARKEGWRLSCEADLARYDRATIEALVDAWRTALEDMLTAPGGSVGASTPLSPLPTYDPAEPRNPQRRRPVVHDEPARQVVTFNDGGARTPVIVMNNRSVYYPLARAMGSDHPFIDVQLYHPDGPFDWPRRAFEDMVADAVRLIRWARPNGPYILAGHCVYGAAAFEAAHQLSERGDEVTLVALFDTWAPGYRETMPFYDQWLRTAQLRLHAYAARVGEWRRGELQASELVWRPLMRALGHSPPPPTALPLPGDWFDKHLTEAAARYQPKPYDGRVVLFRSREALRGRLFDEDMGWRSLVTGDFQTLHTSSLHLDMFREESVADIAEPLGSVLATLGR